MPAGRLVVCEPDSPLGAIAPEGCHLSTADVLWGKVWQVSYGVAGGGEATEPRISAPADRGCRHPPDLAGPDRGGTASDPSARSAGCCVEIPLC